MTTSSAFLAAVLGRPGAALAKSLEGSDLGAWLPARAALGWVQTAGEHGDTIPGTSIPCSLVKGVVGWTGRLGTYSFIEASDVHAAAAVAVHLNAVPGRPDLKDVDLARLGKTVDALVKAQKRRGAAGEGGLSIAAAPQAPVAPVGAIPPGGEDKAAADQEKQAKARKIVLPKISAKKPALPNIRVSKAEAQRACGLCACSQFNGDRFVGCLCFRALAKSVAVRATPSEGYELTLGQGWDLDGALALNSSLHGNL